MRVLLTGASGFVGGHVLRALEGRHEVALAGRGVVDDLARAAPEVVLHLAALTDADLCEREPERAVEVNASLTARIASFCSARGSRLIYLSTDLVFDGERAPYSETDEPRPLSVYGRTKLAGERAGVTTVVRLALAYGPRASAAARPSFIERVVERASRGEKVPLYADELRTPIHVEDAARALILLAEDPTPPALVHLGGPESVSRFEMGRRALAAFDLPAELAEPRSRLEHRGAPRPKDVSLSSARPFPARGLVEGLSAMRRAMDSW
jgi:dTDP-4-dehydrorhamnose reductase